MLCRASWVISASATVFILLVCGSAVAVSSSSSSSSSDHSTALDKCAPISALDPYGPTGSVATSTSLLQRGKQVGKVQIPEANVTRSQLAVTHMLQDRQATRTRPTNGTFLGDFLEPINGTSEAKSSLFPENEWDTDQRQQEHHFIGHLVLVFLLAVLFMGGLSWLILDGLCPSLSYGCVMFIEGLAMALLQPSSWQTFQLSVALWERIDTHLLFFIFLPLLVFSKAMLLARPPLFDRSLHFFWEHLRLAGLGVMLGAVMMAGIGRHLLPYNWDWPTALLFGSILSATDPGEAVASFKSKSERTDTLRLRLLVEGESCFNTVAVVVLFQLCIRVAQGVTPSFDEVLYFLWRQIAWGILLGVLLAFFTGMCLAPDFTKVPCHTVSVCRGVVVFACAYASFFIAENNMQSSGTMALVSFCYFFKFALRESDSAKCPEMVWHVSEFIANTVIFFMAGFMFGRVCSSTYSVVRWYDYGALLMLYLAGILVRAVMLIIVSRERKLGEGVVRVWVGSRGSVSLLLAVIAERTLMTAKATGDRIMFHVGGVAALTMLISGLGLPQLLRLTGLLGENSGDSTSASGLSGLSDSELSDEGGSSEGAGERGEQRSVKQGQKSEAAESLQDCEPTSVQDRNSAATGGHDEQNPEAAGERLEQTYVQNQTSDSAAEGCMPTCVQGALGERLEQTSVQEEVLEADGAHRDSRSLFCLSSVRQDVKDLGWKLPTDLPDPRNMDASKELSVAWRIHAHADDEMRWIDRMNDFWR